MRALSTLALVIFLVSASGAQQSDSLPAQAAVHAWNKTAVIEEISPETLAQLAAQRHRAAAEPQAIASSAALVASSSEPRAVAGATHPLGGFIPAAPAPNAIVDAAAPPSQNDLLAQLEPLSVRSRAEAKAYNSQRYLAASQPESARFPYSTGDKFRLFLKDPVDPFAMVGESFEALYNQARSEPYQFGGGMEGYGKRMGAIFGTDVVSEFFGTFAFPSLLHTDPRYFRMGHGNFFKRAGYALSRTMIVRKDSGGETFNAANWLGGFATTAISDSYYPNRDRSALGIMQHTAVNVAFDSLSDLFREFWPDMAHRLHIPAFVIRRTADPAFPDQKD